MFAWEYDTAEVAAEAEALPGEARTALAAFMEALVFDPVDYARTPEEPTGRALRFLPFGGAGLVAVQVYEPDRLVLVLRVQWFG